MNGPDLGTACTHPNCHTHGKSPCVGVGCDGMDAEERAARADTTGHTPQGATKGPMSPTEQRDIHAAYERDRWAGEWNSLPTAIDRLLEKRDATSSPGHAPTTGTDALLALVKDHRPNYVTEGVFNLDPNRSTQYTRVKCDGNQCDFYAQEPSWLTALDRHSEHLTEVLAQALRDRIHQTALTAINSVYGTDDRHAYMGLRIAQTVIDGGPLPWNWTPRTDRHDQETQ